MKKSAQIGEQIMNVTALFPLLAILVVGIAGGVFLFYSQSYDVRLIEAKNLNYKLKSCIEGETFQFPQSESGAEFIAAFENELTEQCQVNMNVLKNGNWFIGVSVDNGESYLYKQGDIKGCELSDKNEDYPKCVQRSLTKKINQSSQTFLLVTGTNQEVTLRKTA